MKRQTGKLLIALQLPTANFSYLVKSLSMRALLQDLLVAWGYSSLLFVGLEPGGLELLISASLILAYESQAVTEQ